MKGRNSMGNLEATAFREERESGLGWWRHRRVGGHWSTHEATVLSLFQASEQPPASSGLEGLGQRPSSSSSHLSAPSGCAHYTP